jgi:hypothetical protein
METMYFVEFAGKLFKHKCSICGKITTYYKGIGFNSENEIAKNCCHVLKVDKIGYGSIFDGKKVEIPMCDECLKLLVDCTDKKTQEKIYGV